MAGFDWDAAKTIGDLGIGFWEAYSKSKQAKDTSPDDIYRMMNPDSSTPFYNVDNDWNGGNPFSNVTMSDSMKPLVEAMFASVGSPVEKRSMGNGMKELQNANMNWQRARYGLEPMAYEPSETTNPSPTGSPTDVPQVPGGGGRGGGGRGGGGEGGINPGDVLGGAGQGSNEDALNRIIEGLIGGGRASNGFGDFGGLTGNGRGDENLGWQGESGETGWDWLDESGYNPGTWRDDWNGSELENSLGQKDIGSLGGMEAPKVIGGAISAGTGIPGLGWLADKITNGGYNSDKNYFSPVDPNDPYGLNKDPTGMFGGEESLPNSPASAGSSRGNAGSGYGFSSGGSTPGSAGRGWGAGLRASRIGYDKKT